MHVLTVEGISESAVTDSDVYAAAHLDQLCLLPPAAAAAAARPVGGGRGRRRRLCGGGVVIWGREGAAAQLGQLRLQR